MLNKVSIVVMNTLNVKEDYYVSHALALELEMERKFVLIHLCMKKDKNKPKSHILLPLNKLNLPLQSQNRLNNQET